MTGLYEARRPNAGAILEHFRSNTPATARCRPSSARLLEPTRHAARRRLAQADLGLEGRRTPPPKQLSR